MIRHLEYIRARLAQASDRLGAAIHPETRPLDVQDGEVLVPYRPHQNMTVKLV